jgi:hypothetical protein
MPYNHSTFSPSDLPAERAVFKSLWEQMKNNFRKKLSGRLHSYCWAVGGRDKAIRLDSIIRQSALGYKKIGDVTCIFGMANVIGAKIN